MRILLWHVHGSWTTAFVQGRHDYALPVLPDRGPDGLGRARTWEWPARVVERTPKQLAREPFDVVVLQRPHEVALTHRWTGRCPGVDVSAVYVEHNAPEPHPVLSRHPVAGRSDIPLVHVTHFNHLFWDNGWAPSSVIEHAIVDPGALYTGELPRAGVVINEPVRRGRMVGTDLLAAVTHELPIDLFGMQVDRLAVSLGLDRTRPRCYPDLPQHAMHAELARRRVYLHPVRWTSLGMSLIEAMHLGMPVVAVAATEVVEAVPLHAGVVSTDVRRLVDATRTYLADPEAAHVAGKAGRAYALERYGLGRFLAEWDALLQVVTR